MRVFALFADGPFDVFAAGHPVELFHAGDARRLGGGVVVLGLRVVGGGLVAGEVGEEFLEVDFLVVPGLRGRYLSMMLYLTL